MGGRKRQPHSFIQLLCARHWKFKDKQDGGPIFEDLLQTKTTLAKVLLRSEFLSLNNIEPSQLCLDKTSDINGPKQGPILPY